jgi:hypothetical protein
MMVFPMSLSFPFTLQELQTTESLHSITPGLRNKWGHNASRSGQDLCCAPMRLNVAASTRCADDHVSVQLELSAALLRERERIHGGDGARKLII